MTEFIPFRFKPGSDQLKRKMEVDGRKIRQSLYQGSDDINDFPCSPCAKEGKNVSAVKHCVECDENMCSTCLNHHNKFSSMKGHQLLDTVKIPSEERPELPSQRCDKHGGKLIDVYCPNHDKVCCSTCIAVEHSTCHGISFIPDIAKHSKGSEELQQLETVINSLQSRFIALKQKKQAYLDNLKQEKDTLLYEIRTERKKINDQLDTMEKELQNEVDVSIQVKLQNTESEIKEVENTLASLKINKQKILTAKKENVSEKYVQVKLGHERIKTAEAHLNNLKRSNTKGRLWFTSYSDKTNSKTNIIGRVINYSLVEFDHFIGEFDASVRDDDARCEISDMCICTDGNLVLVDYSNKRVKKMNNSYTVTSFLTLSDNPFGICPIDASRLAVTLINKKKVQFISNTELMTLHKMSFNVGDRCRGIACEGGLIYVCCGGSRSEYKNEKAGHLEVYSLKGEILKAYYDDLGLGCPSYVLTQEMSTALYVADIYGDLLIINMECELRHALQENTKFKSPRGTCWINRNQMCSVGQCSNNVTLMSCDGHMHEELLTDKHGIKDPSGVCFDVKQSRLLVSAFENNKIKVYYLNISNC